jgi:CHAD domain-containing protein
MSLPFQQQRHVARQVRRIAEDLAGKAEDDARSGTTNFDKKVHRLRTRCKKLRGLLRLVQPGFSSFKAENAAVRDAADLLGGTRDAAVLIDTFATLASDDDCALSAALKDAVSAHLDNRARQLAHGAPRVTLLTEFADQIGEVRARAGRWEFDATGYGIIEPGLQRTYRSFCDAMAEAIDSKGDDHAMHEWRKHVKYHFHHVTLLAKSAPDLLEPRISVLKMLGTRLGEHHDLAVLAETLRDDHGAIAADGLEAVQHAIVERQAKLERSTFSIGRQLAAESPKALRRRFARQWKLLPREAPDGDRD